MEHRVRLVVREDLERGELEQVAVLDLLDTMTEEALPPQLVEDLTKDCLVTLPLEVVAINEPGIVVQHLIVAVTSEQLTR